MTSEDSLFKKQKLMLTQIKKYLSKLEDKSIDTSLSSLTYLYSMDMNQDIQN